MINEIKNLIDKIIDKLAGTKEEDYLTEGEAEYVDRHFNDFPIRVRR